jgi:hypothetical protein
MSGHAQCVTRTFKRRDNIRSAVEGITELGGRLRSFFHRDVALLRPYSNFICIGASICRCTLQVIHLLLITYGIDYERKLRTKNLATRPFGVSS